MYYAGISGGEFLAGIVILVLSTVVFVAAFWPNRQYKDVERGMSPKPGKRSRIGRYRDGTPPVVAEPPSMTPAEAGFVALDCGPSDMTLATIVDLAARGYLYIVEYQELAIPRSTIVVVVRKRPGPECDEVERELLNLFQTPGAAEASAFVSARPFDARYFRSQLLGTGVAKLGAPTARASGLRRSISQRLGAFVFRRAVEDHEWFDRWHEAVVSAGALMLVGGSIAWVVAAIGWFAGYVSHFWMIVFGIAALAGAATFAGTEGRSADGSVAHDQALGFRRFLVEGSQNADPRRLSGYAGWAVALDCVDEWARSLDGLTEKGAVEEMAPWLTSTERNLAAWSDVADVIRHLRARIHAEDSSDDSSDPLPPLRAGWKGTPSSWPEDKARPGG